MNILQGDTRNIELTPEFIEKSDRDIETIKALDSLATSTGNILVLSGGYAVEAHCGGKIVRPHGDIDAHIILTGDTSNEDIFSKVDILLKNENTPWILRDKKSDKVDYLENDDDKEFFNKRRVEVRLNTPHETNVKYPKKKLINSYGEEIEVCIVDLNQMTADKIRKFYDLRDGVDTTKDRHSSKSDFFDLKRLLELEELDKDKLRKDLPHEYGYVLTLIEQYK